MAKVINESHAEKIEERFRPVLDDVVGLYKNAFGSNLVSVYLQGSVGRGDFVDGVSDIDTHSFTHELRTDEQRKVLDQGEAKLLEKYPWIPKIDIINSTVEHFQQTPRLQFLIATDSVLLYGKQLEPTVDFPRVGLELAKFLSTNTERDIASTIEGIESGDLETSEDYRTRSRWLAKRALRQGLGLVMTQETFYTRTVEAIKPKVIEHFPELAEDIEAIADTRQNPASDRAGLEGLFSHIRNVAEQAREAGILES